MAPIKDIGEITISSDELHWIIPNFYDFPQEESTVIRSPRFHFQDRDWNLQVYPNGSGWFGISATIYGCKSRCRIVRLGILGANKRNFVNFSALFKKGMYGRRFFPSSFLENYKDFMVPGGNLHVVFDTKNDSNNLNRQFFIQLASENVEEWFKEKFENIEASTQRSIEASTQTEDVIQQPQQNRAELAQDKQDNDGESSCVKQMQSLHLNRIWSENLQLHRPFPPNLVRNRRQQYTEKRAEKLRQDLKEILLSGNISDLVLKVEDEEFNVHRSILAARSPVFLAMMMHETKEKKTGIVEIPDVDPKTFSIFLSYLYTGSENNLTSESSAKLYTIADKYQVQELKESCLEHMLSNISNENFCDVFTLSLRHDERDLKETCIQFFADNSLDIILTSKWQTFLCENPIIGNELFIKHLQLNK